MIVRVVEAKLCRCLDVRVFRYDISVREDARVKEDIMSFFLPVADCVSFCFCGNNQGWEMRKKSYFDVLFITIVYKKDRITHLFNNDAKSSLIA